MVTGPRRPWLRLVPRRGPTLGCGPCWGMLETFPQPARESRLRISHNDSGHSQDWFDRFRTYLKLLQVRLRRAAVSRALYVPVDGIQQDRGAWGHKQIRGSVSLNFTIDRKSTPSELQSLRHLVCR